MRHLKVFGTSVMVHVPKVKRRKFDPKAVKGVFVGYCEDTKGFRVYLPESHKFEISRDVEAVNEDGQVSRTESPQEVRPVQFMELLTEETIVPVECPDVNANNSDDEEEGAAINNTLETSGDDFEDACSDHALPPQQLRPVEESQQGLRRSGRERICPGKYDDFVTYGTFSGEVIPPQPSAPSMLVEDVPQSYDLIVIAGSRR